MTEELLVSLYGEPVGALRRRPGGGAIFHSDPGWARSRFQPLLGVSWLQDPRPRSSDARLPAWFEGLIPEHPSAIRARICQSHGVPEQDSFGLIARIGTDLPGAVVITPESDGAPDLPPETDASAEVAPIRRPLHFSLAGVQPKFSLALRDGKLTLPVRGEQGAFIAKLADRAMPELPAVEQTTMRWAERAGLDVPHVEMRELSEIDDLAPLSMYPGDSCLLVTRFDRSPDGPIHQEDLAQVLSVNPSEKYLDHPGGKRISHEQLITLVRDLCGDADATRAVERVAFLILSGNTDAHLKNWSIQLPLHGRVRLAPAYDQVAVITWRDRFGWGHSDGPMLPFPIGRERAFSRIDADVIRRFTDACWNPARAREAFFGALTRGLRAWTDIEPNVIRPMREAIAEHLDRVPLLRGLRL